MYTNSQQSVSTQHPSFYASHFKSAGAVKGKISPLIMSSKLQQKRELHQQINHQKPQLTVL